VNIYTTCVLLSSSHSISILSLSSSATSAAKHITQCNRSKTALD